MIIKYSKNRTYQDIADTIESFNGGQRLSDWERGMICLLEEHNIVSVIKPRQAGMSTFMLWYSNYLLNYSDGGAKLRVDYIAGNTNVANRAFKEYREMIAPLGFGVEVPGFRSYKEQLRHPPPLTGKGVLFLDEYLFYNDSVDILRYARGKYDKIICTSTYYPHSTSKTSDAFNLISEMADVKTTVTSLELDYIVRSANSNTITGLHMF